MKRDVVGYLRHLRLAHGQVLETPAHKINALANFTATLSDRETRKGGNVVVSYELCSTHPHEH